MGGAHPSNFSPFFPAGRLTMRLTKEALVANLHLMKIHWLIIRLHIVKGFSSLVMKMHH